MAKVNYSYINEYNRENYDRITIILPKGAKERVKQMAEARGQNMSEFIASLIPKKIVGTFKVKGKENAVDI